MSDFIILNIHFYFFVISVGCLNWLKSWYVYLSSGWFLYNSILIIIALFYSFLWYTRDNSPSTFHYQNSVVVFRLTTVVALSNKGKFQKFIKHFFAIFGVIFMTTVVIILIIHYCQQAVVHISYAATLT